MKYWKINPENMLHFNKRRQKQWLSVGVIALLIINIVAFLVLISYHHDYRHDKQNTTSNPNSEPISPTWIRISDTIHVYSAHYDPRIPHGPELSQSTLSSSRYPQNNFLKVNLSLIRIIGIKRFPSPALIRATNPLSWLHIKEETYFHEKYDCQLFIHQGNSYTKITSSLLTYHVIEEGIKTFAACFFNCYFNATIGNSSSFVSLTPKNVANYPDKLLRVETNFPENFDKPSDKPSSLAICVRPLFSLPQQDFALRRQLIQFISYYVAMGVTTFNFYELTIFPQVRSYLSKISRLTTSSGQDNSSNFRFRVNRFAWNLPTGNTSELWDFGALAALNDCLYRNMGAGHVLFVDLDEFLVPQQKTISDISTLIKYLENLGPKPGDSVPAQIIFRNTFFCSEFCRDHHNASVDNATFFPLSSCTTRTKRVWVEKLRSKFAVRPCSIISVGHHTSHNFWRQGPGQGHRRLSITASPSLALLHHYRDCGPISTRKNPIFNRLTVKDENILRILRDKAFIWLD